MKKFLSVLMAGLVVFMMFGVGGGKVLAAESNESGQAIDEEPPCACHDFTLLTGAVRNKVVSDLLKTDGFKTAKKEAMALGYNWDGAGKIEAAKFNQPPVPGALFVAVEVPFTNKDGITMIVGFLFVNGELYGPPIYN